MLTMFFTVISKFIGSYGSIVMESTPATTTPGGEHVQQQLTKARQKLYERMDFELGEGMEIAEDYGMKIKEARERAGLKQTELAQKINEKQSLLRKIEHEEILPTDEVRKKIERILKITL